MREKDLPEIPKMDISNRYIAYCGIDCTTCPRYQGSCPEGCLGGICADDCGLCEVRICGLERHVTNCGNCEQYPCQKLENQYTNMVNDGFSEWATTAKAALEEVRSKRIM